MLGHLTPMDRYRVLLSWFYTIVGRAALIFAFVLGLDGDLKIAVALLAVALWMIWSDHNVSFAMFGETVDLLAKRDNARPHENTTEIST